MNLTIIRKHEKGIINIGNGKYSTYIDSSQMEYKISDSVIEFILESIN